MVSLDKIYTNVQTCGIEISFGATPKPSVISGWQPFYNTTYENADFQKIYAGLASINFGEESALSAAGYFYKQKATFRFPAADANRVERIMLLNQIKFLNIKLTDGRTITLGRNDYNQNTAPIISIKNNERTVEVSLDSQSIFSAGFTPTSNGLLPSLIPLSFNV
jgi:hypothetical protein